VEEEPPTIKELEKADPGQKKPLKVILIKL
jgi:hypothetical protein